MQQRFVALDGLRGIAALAVVLLHGELFFGRPPLPNAHLAVDFFFALSGFVLAHAYEDRLKTEALTPLAFFRERIIRLYPLYALGSVLGLAVLAALQLFGDGAGDQAPAANYAVAIVTAALFLPSPLPVASAYAFPLLFVAWSLFFELAANLLYAIVAPRLTPLVLGAIILAGAAALAATGLRLGTLAASAELATFWGGFPKVLYTFFAGVAVYRLWRAGFLKADVPALVPLAGLVALLALPSTLASELFGSLVAVPVLLILGAQAQVSGRIAGLCVLMGTASYPLYTLHPAALAVVLRALAFLGLPPDIASPILGIAVVAALFAGSLLAERYYDRPVRRLLKTFKARQAPAVAG
jgi:peptidoglycan/LPS O-acetylase OafA/YrhL